MGAGIKIEINIITYKFLSGTDGWNVSSNNNDDNLYLRALSKIKFHFS
jgi:hypothetical protein